MEDKAPSRDAGEIDNRGTHFYLALYWAEALANQNDDLELKAEFKPVLGQLAAREEEIVTRLGEIQKRAVDIGGYYHPDEEKADAAMRPCAIYNEIIDLLT